MAYDNGRGKNNGRGARTGGAANRGGYGRSHNDYTQNNHFHSENHGNSDHSERARPSGNGGRGNWQAGSGRPNDGPRRNDGRQSYGNRKPDFRPGSDRPSGSYGPGGADRNDNGHGSGGRSNWRGNSGRPNDGASRRDNRRGYENGYSGPAQRSDKPAGPSGNRGGYDKGRGFGGAQDGERKNSGPRPAYGGGANRYGRGGQNNFDRKYDSKGISAERGYAKPAASGGHKPFENSRTPDHRYDAPPRKYDAPAPQDAPDAAAEQPDQSIICGRNSVLELLKSGRSVDKIFTQKGEREGSITLIAGMAIKAGIPLVEVDRRKLDDMTGHAVHQGVAAVAAYKNYCEPEDILRAAAERGESALIVVADGITDQHNLGAVIRSAECAGAHGVIIPKRRASGISAVVSKASAGAVEHIAIAKVSNIAQTVEWLKRQNIWVWAADAGAGGTPYGSADLAGPCAIVLGDEGEGVSRNVREKCDGAISIPMRGKIGSLNVSCAASVLLFAAAGQRAEKK